MSPIIVYEGDIWSKSDCVRLFGIMNMAVDGGFVKKIHGNYQNCFVGWWCIKGRLVISLPKLFSEFPTDWESIHLLFNVLERYSASIPWHERSVDGWIQGEAQLPILYSELCEYTFTYGWHLEDDYESSDLLEVADWNQTVATQLGFTSGNDLLFLETIGQQHSVKNGPLAPIQACAILDLRERLGSLVDPLDSLFHIILNDAQEIQEEEKVPISIDSVILEWLEANRDHDRLLAEILRVWISMTQTGNISKGHHGTFSFALVWEELLRAALASVGIKVSHSKEASQPCYYRNDNTRVYKPGSQRPDFMLVIDDGIVIADAKWYKPNFFPGTSDIIKQIGYEITCHDYVLSNSFLVPTFGKKIEFLGYCGMEWREKLDSRFNNLNIIGVPIMSLMKHYNNHTEFIIGNKLEKFFRRFRRPIE